MSSTRQKQSILFFVSFLILFCDLTFGAEKEKIAVATFDAKVVSAAEAEIVANFLRSDMVNTQKFTVLDRTNMDKILNEQKFQMSGCTNMECAVEVGRILNVRKMVVGTLSKLGTFYYLEVSVVDVETSAIVFSLREKCKDLDEIEALTKKVAGQLSGVEVKEEKKEVEKPAEKKEEKINKRIQYKTIETTSFANRVAIGLNYPGFHIRYGISDNILAEIYLRTWSIGGRGYYLFISEGSVIYPYLGVDYSLAVRYSGNRAIDTIDNYYNAGGFIGTELYFAPIGIGLDTGISYMRNYYQGANYIILKSGDRGIAVMFNIHLSFYF
ncbi:MAG: CsgG/HfaB family protein [Candidatus Firestonebacteria bacterium]